MGSSHRGEISSSADSMDRGEICGKKSAGSISPGRSYAARQAAKTTLFAAGNAADVQKSAAPQTTFSN
jgi:hypothetical protein